MSLPARGYVFQGKCYLDLHIHIAAVAAVKYLLCRTRSTYGAVDKYARCLFGNETYAVAFVACRTMWMEAPGVDVRHPSVQSVAC